MKSGPQPEPRLKMLKLDIILAFGVLVIVIIAASWYAASHHKSSQNNSGIPAGWSQFKSDKYGFKFSYPAFLGKPAVTTTKGKTGNFYQVSFAGASAKITAKPSVLINMYSKDYVNSICSHTDCPPQKSLDSQAVLDSLKNSPKLFIKHDSSSYATLSYNPSLHTSTLSYTQIVNVPKLNTTAAVGLYSLSGTATCPAGKFAQNTQQGCMSNSDYNTFSKVMKSIQGV
jgi:hypothetical protein